MQVSMKTDKKMPYCPGCGHHGATNSLAKALEKSGLDPLDVIVATDIGCCGLLDPLLTCHTIHGLHGRAVALATGVTLGLNDPGKKVVAVLGDGGATIGIQHILEGSRRNINMTIIIQNNMVYGMTGGQISGLSAKELKAIKLPEESDSPPYDICELAHKAGAAHAARIIAKGDFSDKLAEAINTEGFSVVELICMCTAYGYKKISEIENIPFKEKTLKNDRKVHHLYTDEKTSLFESVPSVQTGSSSGLKSRIEIVIAGSAGESIQSAAELLALAGMKSGVNSTKKGEYPITVGTGFSVSEIILSNEKINYTGIETPDLLIITSEDGLNKVKGLINENTKLIIDESLEAPSCKEVVKKDFRKLSGKKGACLAAITYWLATENILPVEALKNAAEKHKHSAALLGTIDKTIDLVEKER